MGAARALPRNAVVAGALALAVLLSVSGCETFRAPAPSIPSPAPKSPASSTTKSPARSYNLTGYSAAFKQGYADACATPRRRDAERLKSDTDYQMGWNDGQSLCRTR